MQYLQYFKRETWNLGGGNFDNVCIVIRALIFGRWKFYFRKKEFVLFLRTIESVYASL